MHIQSHIRAESGCDGCFGCFGHIQPKMVELQPSRVTSRVTSSQKWRTSSPPATFVRNRVLYVKFQPKFSARAARSLAMQIRKSHPESHPCKIQRTQVTSITSESHPRVTSGQNSEASHIRVVTSAITSGQNPVTSRSPPYAARRACAQQRQACC